MVFGEIKTIIEANFVKSYDNKEDFKENLKLFKENFLSNKDLSKMYLLYSDLSSAKGLSEEDAKEYLEEGIKRLKKLKNRVDLPKSSMDHNDYADIDNLVYGNSLNIEETIKSKKNIIKKLTDKPIVYETNINLPLSYSVKVANNEIKKYIENLDESARNDLFDILSRDKSELKEDFERLKEEVSNKIETMLTEEQEESVSSKLKLVLEKVKEDKFDNLNYYKLKNLKESL